MESAFTDYNTVRPHSSVDYLPPDEFERRLREEDGFSDKFLENRKIKEEKKTEKQN
jgi:putative transposase